MTTPTLPARLSTGIPGLDTVLGGGLPQEHIYLLEGGPGTGKTTLALCFAREGVRQGEAVLYVSLAETRTELEGIAASHGWSLRGIHICQLPLPSEVSIPSRRYTLFHPAEVELDQSLKHLMAKLDEIRPARLVLDSLSGLHLLADDALRYRQQIQGLRQLLSQHHCTSLLLDDSQAGDGAAPAASLVHGILSLERDLPEYGSARRRLSVTKLRGVGYPDSYHDYRITTGDFRVFPRLISRQPDEEPLQEQVSSGIAELDAMLGGGLPWGYSILLMGPTGCGKSSLAAQYAVAAARRGESAAVYLFDETRRIYLQRTAALGIPIRDALDTGRLQVERIDPNQISPGEFISIIQQRVEQDGVRLVVLDSLSGYLHAVPAERYLLQQIHELLVYLNHQGVLSLTTAVQSGLLGSQLRPRPELSTLVDGVVLLRFFEIQGRVCKAISVLKHRGGEHDTSIRELYLTASGLRIGEPLNELQGVLSGQPRLLNASGTDAREP